MKIEKLSLTNFMLFSKLDLSFSSGINVIYGDNSTGKTALLKILYTLLQAYRKTPSNAAKSEIEIDFVRKMQGVFKPDGNKIGRLVNRNQGGDRAVIDIELDGGSQIGIDFNRRSSKRVNVSPIDLSMLKRGEVQPIYLPPKEIISATENFSSLYEEFHIAFDETYYDLARLLDRPLKKCANAMEQRSVLEKFESVMSGKVIQKEKKFFLYVRDSGELEMSLISEGYRKLSTILYLISSGSLNANSILFWDEPETNMSPEMIRLIVEAVVELAKMGVQVFISTHDCFVQEQFHLIASSPSIDQPKSQIQLISLFRERAGDSAAECMNIANDLKNNF